MVREDGFGDLVADAHDGVERGHGLLEDHGDGAAAVRAHLIFAESEEVFGFGVRLAGEADAAGEVRRGRKEAEQGEGGGGLAGAGLADEAEGLAGSDVEGDAVDGLVPGEGDAEIADGEQRSR